MDNMDAAAHNQELLARNRTWRALRIYRQADPGACHVVLPEGACLSSVAEKS